MLNKKLTFMLIPDSDGVSRQVSIRLWVVYATAFAALVLLFASFFFASAFLNSQVNEVELTRLQSENSALSKKYEELRWSIAEAGARFEELVQKEIALRSVFGLAEIPTEVRQLGIGGPFNFDLERLSPAARLAYSTEAEVDRLLRLSDYELEKFAEAESALGDLKDRLDHTPSIMPASGWSSRGFGMMNDPFTGYRQMHRGMDIANHAGTPIVATADGRVKAVGTYGHMGKMITIDHGHGFVTRYGHLSKAEVKRGDVVTRGQVIARMGNTGRSTGPHLHYEVWRNGKAVNPHEYILNEL
jgi:murein DD-endopeptidase MepM/ murein hydrolase activator NlpD